tara:strand:- start:47 stop:811 length:765 start_codon:yes stop_codon:yes gene_type:complete
MDSNLTIRKINRCRYNLKKYLNDEWDVSKIKDYSDDEIEKLYNSSKPLNSELQFGNASGCDFNLYHKNIKSHKLHIIHYNFPEIGKPSVKINKTCAEKLNKLYKEEIISPEDSLIIIFYNKISENLGKSIEDLYISGQEELLRNGLSENIQTENDLLNENKYSLVHFRNIHIYHLDELSIDITLHKKVPEHKIIRTQPEINQLLDKCNARINQFPIISRNDAMAKRIRMAPGDICKINRKTKSAGEVEYYRVCK